ncbi:hypothetical protein FZZ91_02970 [Synechococcus sp. HB1133]|uniref:hypothetical protein n=1 Tax=unclassified Synechococcus TaxID=2626047 RepID=UPI00140E87E2|nr:MULTISPECIES: hypothetical protein [unclassified Synechococcus]MCB4394900.1 hypothetical protein [Synechococcus sp. PH41509]MCB4421800.1 hypothetical protein [Synechococcus sp. HB1133]MCB4430253.1 hypothetical protein [Synechococcus sp. HBA1120]NHI80742.1 hypothetical protein [Synechococcus sp. HB1133]
MNRHTYMLLEGEKIQLEVDPDSIITEDFQLANGTIVHAVIGDEEQGKLLSLQKIIKEDKMK